jgi:hypothetical protein
MAQSRSPASYRRPGSSFTRLPKRWAKRLPEAIAWVLCDRVKEKPESRNLGLLVGVVIAHGSATCCCDERIPVSGLISQMDLSSPASSCCGSVEQGTDSHQRVEAASGDEGGLLPEAGARIRPFAVAQVAGPQMMSRERWSG